MTHDLRMLLCALVGKNSQPCAVILDVCTVLSTIESGTRAWYNVYERKKDPKSRRDGFSGTLADFEDHPGRRAGKKGEAVRPGKALYAANAIGWRDRSGGRQDSAACEGTMSEGDLADPDALYGLLFAKAWPFQVSKSQ